jgi:uncharacterized protein (DUF2236 family)
MLLHFAIQRSMLAGVLGVAISMAVSALMAGVCEHPSWTGPMLQRTARLALPGTVALNLAACIEVKRKRLKAQRA